MRVLEQEVVPLYYARDEEGIPRGWIARVKRGIQTLAWRYNADRMVKDYVGQAYLPAAGGSTCRM
jgi:starch phosphorylase